MLVLTPKKSKETELIAKYCKKNNIEFFQPEKYQDLKNINLSNSVFYGGDIFSYMMLDEYSDSFKSNSLSISLLLDLMDFDKAGRKIKLFRNGIVPEFNNLKFIKPVDDKVFKYGIMDYKSYLEVFQNLRGDVGHVFVSDVVDFTSEYRIFNNSSLDIVTHSIYNGDYNKDHFLQIQDFFTKYIMRNDLFDNMAVDIGYIEEFGPAIVEFNPIYCSSFYNCSVGVFIECLYNYFNVKL